MSFFLLLFIFEQFHKRNAWGMDALALLYFAEIWWLYAICTHDWHLWIWIWIWIWMANFISTASLARSFWRHRQNVWWHVFWPTVYVMTTAWMRRPTRASTLDETWARRQKEVLLYSVHWQQKKRTASMTYASYTYFLSSFSFPFVSVAAWLQFAANVLSVSSLSRLLNECRKFTGSGSFIFNRPYRHFRFGLYGTWLQASAFIDIACKALCPKPCVLSTK